MHDHESNDTPRHEQHDAPQPDREPASGSIFDAMVREQPAGESDSPTQTFSSQQRRAQRESDPWAHRRGEPRVFAFFWTLYLMASVMGSVMLNGAVSAGERSAYRPAARMLLVLIAVGICILWPMVRLSQSWPRRNRIGAAVLDCLVIAAPVQMVLWPLSLLAGWPANIVAGIAGALLAWTVLIGSVLGLAFASAGARFSPSRPMWMLVCVFLTFGSLLAAMLVEMGNGTVPDWVDSMSPLTMIGQLTGSGWGGPEGPVSHAAWQSTIAVVIVGLIAWIAAVLVASRRRPENDPTLLTAPDRES